MRHLLILLLDCYPHNNPDAEVAKRAILDDDQNLLSYTLAKNMNSTKIIALAIAIKFLKKKIRNQGREKSRT